MFAILTILTEHEPNPQSGEALAWVGFQSKNRKCPASFLNPDRPGGFHQQPQLALLTLQQNAVAHHRRSEAALRAQCQSLQRHIAAGLANPLGEPLPSFHARRLCCDQAKYHKLIVGNLPQWFE